MLNTNFSPWPAFTLEESEAVSRVLLSNKVNYWTGDECRQFEKEFATWVGVDYAIALMNGTVALDLALLALGIGPGDEVIVTCRTFIASVSCIVSVGATPIFADVDRDSQNITDETIRAVLSPKTKAIICVHLAGWPCDMDPIMDLANRHNLFVIEDCAQAHGAQYKGQSVGSFGDIAAWSFCQDKIMTTGGEGGMVTTKNQKLYQWMWSYKDHGKSWAAFNGQQEIVRSRWVHDDFGTNWRMTEIQAAIGRIQLKKMPDWHRQRLVNAMRVWETAADLPFLRVPRISNDILHAAYKCYVFLEEKYLPEDWVQNRIIKEINQRGVPCYLGSSPEVYLEKAFEETPWRPTACLPVAEELGRTSLMFLVHPTLTEEELDMTCRVLTEVLSINVISKSGCCV